MKAFMGIVGGFVLTLAILGSGLAFATWLVAAKPARPASSGISVADLWTKEARPVDKATQIFERLAGKQTVAPDPAHSAEVVAEIPRALASQPAAGQEQNLQSAGLPRAHVEWCANRYRSYRPDNNRYTSFEGKQRPCISPYLEGSSAERAAEPTIDTVSYVDASAISLDANPSRDNNATELSSDHLQYCFSRYRSYRPQDNSYQPFSGGPRRRCE